MGRLKKIVYQLENGEVVYVHQRVIRGIKKSAYITKEYIEEHPRRLIVEYRDKKFNAHGTMEIIDLGPDVPKKNIKEGITI